MADMDDTHCYRWFTPGDLNAFFGLCIDNLAGLVLTVSLLAAVFGYPAEFALGHLVPGTAVGVVVGDLLFTWMAFRLARRTGRTDVTAMPLGLDTPSTFGMVFLVLGPAFRTALDGGLSEQDAARH
nr:permease [Pirellulales bacterium]